MNGTLAFDLDKPAERDRFMAALTAQDKGKEVSNANRIVANVRRLLQEIGARLRNENTPEPEKAILRPIYNALEGAIK